MIHNKLPVIWYGGDYNPDQWTEDIWIDDMKYIKKAGMSVVTLPVFSWAKLQPDENKYDFSWLHTIIDLIWENGLYVCLATSTAVQPAWMSNRFPDVLPVTSNGTKRTHGSRVNFCPNSPTYRKYSTKLAERLALEFGDHPALAVWHVGNEYGTWCWCDTCAEEFRVWVKKRYGTITKVNEKLNLSFWGHTIYDWKDIIPPSKQNGDDRNFQGLSLDYARFMSESSLACYRSEADILRKITPAIKVTTNLMGTFKALDYFSWAKHMDIISWDNYPTIDTLPFEIALKHDLMRGLKNGKSFMLMEQTPSQQNWQNYNSLKRPGVMALQSWQAVAHGADTVMFFQLRRSKGGCEKLHGALIEHCGHDNTRVFKECQDLGEQLRKCGSLFLDAETDSEVAFVFDWENWWALDLSVGPSIDIDYIALIKKYYRVFYEARIPVDFIHPSNDLSKYKIVVAPLLYMAKKEFTDAVEKLVASGKTFITTYFSGLVDENDLIITGGYPGRLRKLLGIFVEEIDALPKSKRNTITISNPWRKIAGEYSCESLFEILHLEGAEMIASYSREFYRGHPAVTMNNFGNGKAYYIATDAEQNFLNDMIGSIIQEMSLIKHPFTTVSNVEITSRRKNDVTYYFLLNYNSYPIDVRISDNNSYWNILTHEVHKNNVIIKGNDVIIIRESNEE